MKEMKIVIRGSQVKFVYSDDLIGLLDQGDHKITRASHVEPSADGWTADMSPSGGGELGPFKRRSDALEAEVAWINTRL